MSKKILYFIQKRFHSESVDFGSFKEYLLLVKGQTENTSFMTSVRDFCWKKVQDKCCMELGAKLFASCAKNQKNSALSQIWDLVNLHMLTVRQRKKDHTTTVRKAQ